MFFCTLSRKGIFGILEDNKKMDFKEVCFEDMDCILMAQDRV
jgi:hypothetical protein